jgi:hypothetical protein
MSRKHEVPKVVRVGGLRYRVVVEEEMVSEEGVEILGQHDYGRLQLRLSLAADPEVRPFVLFHEVLHACIAVSGGDSHQEEALVSGLAHVLLQVLRENPDLVRYLLGGWMVSSGGSGRRAEDARAEDTAKEADGGSTGSRGKNPVGDPGGQPGW